MGSDASGWAYFEHGNMSRNRERSLLYRRKTRLNDSVADNIGRIIWHGDSQPENIAICRYFQMTRSGHGNVYLLMPTCRVVDLVIADAVFRDNIMAMTKRCAFYAGNTTMTSGLVDDAATITLTLYRQYVMA